MHKPPFRFGCILLAAGASTRMGRPKQLLEVDGRPLVARAAEAVLASPAWPVVVVVGSQAQKIRPVLARLPVLVAENPDWKEGLGSSIRSGVAALKNFWRSLDAVLIALADQPALSAGTIARLTTAYDATGRSIAAARYGGHLGAPALLGRQHFSTLQELQGDQGARALLELDPGQVAAVDLPEFAFDLDTPADYERLRPSKDALNSRASSSAKPTSEARTEK
ncbi:MAG TPA: nucleotidyltransferase family protein [Opitutaceae bacterium]|nr:nucleotidyltransferase family protein [Opitutaceae bacterium]